MPESPQQERAAARAHLAALPPKSRARVRELLRVVRAAVPGAALGFSYRMPLLRLDGRPLLWVGAFARHVGLYPITAAVRARLAASLAHEDTAKGTLRFGLDAPVRTGLVRRIAAVRAAELRRATARAERGRKRRALTRTRSQRRTS